MNFPKHLGLELAHNRHKLYYQPIAEYLNDRLNITPEEVKLILDTDEIWEIQWYPDTPIGFYAVAASTLEKALEAANEPA